MYIENDLKFLRDLKNYKLKDIVNIIKDGDIYLNSLEVEDRVRDISIIGVGWDSSTAGKPGARFSPKYIINKLLDLSLSDQGFSKTIDFLGFLKIIISDKNQTFNNIKYIAKKLINLYKTIIFIGGDHSITNPILEIILEKYNNLNLIVFDSHFDLREIEEGLSGGTYLIDTIKYSIKNNFNLNVMILGIKESANPYYLFDNAKKYNVNFLRSLDLLRDKNLGIDFINRNINKEYPVYISLDVDSIDSTFIDSVNSSYGVNLKPFDIIYIIDYIKKNYNVISLDIVEFNPLVGNLDKSLNNLVEILYYFLFD
ncbi:MAG: arginase family protein [bacterium]